MTDVILPLLPCAICFLAAPLVFFPVRQQRRLPAAGGPGVGFPAESGFIFHPAGCRTVATCASLLWGGRNPQFFKKTRRSHEAFSVVVFVGGSKWRRRWAGRGDEQLLLLRWLPWEKGRKAAKGDQFWPSLDTVPPPSQCAGNLTLPLTFTVRGFMDSASQRFDAHAAGNWKSGLQPWMRRGSCQPSAFCRHSV